MTVRRIDLRGRVFGALTVLADNPVTENQKVRWTCRCQCGDVRTVITASLLAGKTTKCPRCARGGEANGRFIHGHAYRDSTSPEYEVWGAMKARCSRPTAKDYRHYGGRGIKVCDRWAESYEAFISDMGRRPTPKHQIDRIDNDGDYELGNCRWATKIEQANNTRATIRVELNGEMVTIRDVAAACGKTPGSILFHLRAGKSLEHAMRHHQRPRVV